MASSFVSSSHKNPSRKECEKIILRILTREIEEYGRNHHFKQASDFMPYFESLHPASPGLTKQVQRAITSLNLPRDKNGYFLVNISEEEYHAECELAHLLHGSSIVDLSDYTPILIKVDAWNRRPIIHFMESVPNLNALYEMLAEADSGILVYTKTPEKLISYLTKYITPVP